MPVMQCEFSPLPACGERGRGEDAATPLAPRAGRGVGGEGSSLLPAGEGLGMREKVSPTQGPSRIEPSLAGGSPAASDFLLFAQEKVTKEKGTPLRWPSASLSLKLTGGRRRTRLAIKRTEARLKHAAPHYSALQLKAAATQRGTVKGNTNFPSPRLRGEGGPKGRVRGQVLKLNPPLCRRGRLAELGAVEASVFEHVATEINFSPRIVRVCEPPNSASRRAAPGQRTFEIWERVG